MVFKGSAQPLSMALVLLGSSIYPKEAARQAAGMRDTACSQEVSHNYSESKRVRKAAMQRALALEVHLRSFGN